jgi:hypothetical protein
METQLGGNVFDHLERAGSRAPSTQESSENSASGLLLSSIFLSTQYVLLRGTGVTEGARRATGVNPVRAMLYPPWSIEFRDC